MISESGRILLLQPPAGSSGGSGGVWLSRSMCAALVLVQLVQAAVCGAAAWTIWQGWREHRAWERERAELLARLETTGESRSGFSPRPAAEPEAVLAGDGAAGPDSAARNADGGALESQAPDLASSASVDEAQEAADRAADPETPSAAPEETPPDETELDAGLVRIRAFMAQREGDRLRCSFELRNARPGTSVGGTAEGWLLDGQGGVFPLEFESAAFSIKNMKVMHAGIVCGPTAPGSGPGAAAVLIAIRVQGAPALRVRLPLGGTAGEPERAKH